MIRQLPRVAPVAALLTDQGHRAAPRAEPGIAVVVPARNEEAGIRSCLEAIAASRSALPGERAARVRVVVAADRCSDRTVAVARSLPGVTVVTTDRGRVGGARAVGVRAALRGPGPRPAWIACTDADSLVPADWLGTHWDHATAGTDLLLGTVRLDPVTVPADVAAAWLERHDLTDGHPHVHGANLGVSTRMYRRVGGFSNVAVHEDLLLAQAIRSAGGRVVSTGSSPVLTSARLIGRTPSGMAGYLAELVSEPA